MIQPRLVLGAPVADRAWALPRWLDQVASQTVLPDGLIFIHTETGDGTQDLLAAETRWPIHLIDAQEPYVRREQRLADREHTFTTLANHRNRLLDIAVELDADLILSLDTDIFLTDPTAIEQLAAQTRRTPLSSAVVYLHEHGQTTDPPIFNAALWVDAGRGPERRWRRPSRQEFDEAQLEPDGVMCVDIPMAVVMMRRDVALRCRYRYHECGEDLGFALDLDRHGLWCDWLTRLELPHVMNPNRLDELVPA